MKNNRALLKIPGSQWIRFSLSIKQTVFSTWKKLKKFKPSTIIKNKPLMTFSTQMRCAVKS
jgi:hypothetical protein